jgi:hypothetical protein
MATKKKEIVPDVSLFGKLGARSRAFPLVVTELVDNSLDSWIALPESKKKGLSLNVDISAKTGKDPWFIIKDNAGGMTLDELVSALTVAKSNKTEFKSKFLGHYGLGLKSAVMYIGPKFKIFSRSYRDPGKVNFVEFDRDKFEKSGAWELEFQEISKDRAAELSVYFPDGHGTEIQVRNDRYSPGSKDSVMNRLRRTFAPRLPKSPRLKIENHGFDDDMKITFNGETVMAAGAFYEVWEGNPKNVAEQAQEFLRIVKRNHKEARNVSTDYIKGQVSEGRTEAAVIPTKLKWFEDIPGVRKIPEIKINGKRVSGRIGILDRGMAHQNEYGFDLVKNGRVIEENVLDRDLKDKKVGLIASNHNARITGQLFLDDWETDHQKVSFLKDSKDWEALAEHVGKQVKDFHRISSLLQNPKKYLREKLGIVDENDPDAIADGKFEQHMPQIAKGVQSAARSSAVKDTMNRLEKSRGAPAKSSGKGKSAPPPIPRPGPKPPKDGESTTTLVFTKPEISFERKGEEAPIVNARVRKERGGNVLEIELNRDHPFLASRESTQLNAIGEFLAVDYFASYMLRNKPILTHEDFIVLRDTVLREAGRKI